MLILPGINSTLNPQILCPVFGDKLMLMWAFYANQFKGICIEVDLNKNGNGNYEIAKVEYRDRRIQLDELKDLDINEKAKYLLRRKIKIWKDEKEVRTISENNYVQHGIKIKSILLGLKVSDERRELVNQWTPPHIPIYETRIDEKNKIIKGEKIKRNSQPIEILKYQ